VEKPGEYNVLVTAYDPTGGYRVEKIHVARLRVKGEICEDIEVTTVDFNRVASTPLARVVKEVILAGVVNKGAVSYLKESLEWLARYKMKVSGVITHGLHRDEEIRVEFRNVDASKIARIVMVLGVEELEISIRASGAINPQELVRAPIVNPINPVSQLVKIRVEECRNI